jgi:ribosomal protein S27E
MNFEFKFSNPECDHKEWIFSHQNPKIDCASCNKDSDQIYKIGENCREGHKDWVIFSGDGIIVASAFCPLCGETGSKVANKMEECKKNHVGEKKGCCMYCRIDK